MPTYRQYRGEGRKKWLLRHFTLRLSFQPPRASVRFELAAQLGVSQPQFKCAAAAAAADGAAKGKDPFLLGGECAQTSSGCGHISGSGPADTAGRGQRRRRDSSGLRAGARPRPAMHRCAAWPWPRASVRRGSVSSFAERDHRQAYCPWLTGLLFSPGERTRSPGDRQAAPRTPAENMPPFSSTILLLGI